MAALLLPGVISLGLAQREDTASCGEIKLSAGSVSRNAAGAGQSAVVFDARISRNSLAERTLQRITFQPTAVSTALPSDVNAVALLADASPVATISVDGQLAVTFDGLSLAVPRADASLSLQVRAYASEAPVEGRFLQYEVPADGILLMKDGQFETCYKKAVGSEAAGWFDIAATRLQVDAPVAVGAGQAFLVSVTAVDAHGNMDGDVTGPIGLVVDSPLVGGLLPDLPSLVAAGGLAEGTATLYAEGAATLTATMASLVGSATVLVSADGAARIELSPAAAALPAGGTVTFVASAFDAFGNPVDGSVSWEATCGDVSAEGAFTAPTEPAECQVTATEGLAAAVAQITVLPGPLDHLHVVPAAVVLEVGSALSFIALGHDTFHNVVPAAPAWEASCGSITELGAYEAPFDVGTCEITASRDGLAATAQAEIVAGAAVRLALEPESANVPAGGTLSLSASGFDSYGNAVQTVPSWAADCGEVDPSGVFTAPTTAGLECAVEAALGDLTARAVLLIAPADLAEILVQGPSTVIAGEPGRYSFTGRDEFGNEVSLPEPERDFVSNETGTFELCTSQLGVTGCLAGGITVRPGAPVVFRIEPASSVRNATDPETIPFAAILRDAYGNLVPTDSATEVSWSIDPDGGAFLANVLAPAALPGTFAVAGSLTANPALNGSATVTTLPAAGLAAGGGGGGGGGAGSNGNSHAPAPPCTPVEAVSLSSGDAWLPSARLVLASPGCPSGLPAGFEVLEGLPEAQSPGPGFWVARYGRVVLNESSGVAEVTFRARLPLAAVPEAELFTPLVRVGGSWEVLGPEAYETRRADGHMELVLRAPEPGALVGLAFDTGAPHVHIQAPAPAVGGAILVRIQAWDNVGVEWVSLRLDGREIARDSTAPFEFALYTDDHRSGLHSLAALAWDPGGNEGMSLTAFETLGTTLALPPGDSDAWLWAVVAGMLTMAVGGGSYYTHWHRHHPPAPGGSGLHQHHFWTTVGHLFHVGGHRGGGGAP